MPLRFAILLTVLLALAGCSSLTPPATAPTALATRAARPLLNTKTCQGLRVADVQQSRRYPPDCDQSVPGCLEMNDQGMVLSVWLEAPAGCNLDQLAEELTFEKELYLISPSGQRVSRLLAGLYDGKVVLGFGLPQAGGVWQMVLADNPPVDVSPPR